MALGKGQPKPSQKNKKSWKNKLKSPAKKLTFSACFFSFSVHLLKKCQAKFDNDESAGGATLEKGTASSAIGKTLLLNWLRTSIGRQALFILSIASSSNGDCFVKSEFSSFVSERIVSYNTQRGLVAIIIWNWWISNYKLNKERKGKKKLKILCGFVHLLLKEPQIIMKGEWEAAGRKTVWGALAKVFV